MKILALDIETSPILGYAWRPWQTDIRHIVQDSYVLMVGYQWVDENEPVDLVSLPDFKTAFRRDKADDSKLSAKVNKLIQEADLILAHNVNFDLKILQGRMLMHGLPPIGKKAQFCTLRESKKLYKFTSHKLDSIARGLGLDPKLATGGMQLWVDVLQNEPEAWEKMGAYCKHDVELLVDIFEKIRPWSNITTVPAEGWECPKCGSDQVERKYGFYYSPSGLKRQRYKCAVCGGVSVSRTSIPQKGFLT